ncbi:MAG: preprotein translocase subunit SecG [Pseudomonadota bacterium]|nr:preprotein translocase subunit SecG [Pseudomonadota bacterium]
METILLVIHVLIGVGLVGLVLLQHGKGADMGASFGAGASQTVLGSAGSGNLLSRSTALLAALFFATSFSLAVVAKNKAAALSGGELGFPPAAVVEPRTAGPSEDREAGGENPGTQTADGLALPEAPGSEQLPELE